MSTSSHSGQEKKFCHCVRDRPASLKHTTCPRTDYCSVPCLGPDHTQNPLLCARELAQAGRTGHSGERGATGTGEARLKSVPVSASAEQRSPHREEELPSWPCSGVPWTQGWEVGRGARPTALCTGPQPACGTLSTDVRGRLALRTPSESAAPARRDPEPTVHFWRSFQSWLNTRPWLT